MHQGQTASPLWACRRRSPASSLAIETGVKGAIAVRAR
jgi:hypothetical protein